MDVKELLKAVIELLKPNLDSYRKPSRKGRVIATYPSDGQYVCDIEILLNDNQPDDSEPIVKGVEIPVIWGGENRGIICPPSVGTICDVEYYHGDPNYPRISNFRWKGSNAPSVGTDELIIQQGDDIFIHIKADGAIIIKGNDITIDGGNGDISGAITHKCICPITGAPHIDYSTNVYISK